MNPQSLVASLAAGPETLRALTAGLAGEQTLWRPGPGKWSILEVICHLADEEREDFRTRLDLTLHDPGAAWPSIDPEGWVNGRNYQQREFAGALENLMQEREKSLVWLGSLDAPQWENSFEHPRLGTLRAGDILTSWAAHDLLHIRQLTELHHGWLCEQSAPYEAGYAGEW